MNSTLADTSGTALAGPRRITGAPEFELDPDTFASAWSLDACPGCGPDAPAAERGHPGAAHRCDACGTWF